MNRVVTRIGLYWFEALLPPLHDSKKQGDGVDNDNDEDDDDQCYFEVLGVSPSVTKEEIRRAYKKKSLRLHPDKVLQRGEDPARYRVEYQRVQEANEVLSDPSKRSLYQHVAQSSPKRYRFLRNPNPAAAYQNLVGAPVHQKTRIVVLGILLLTLLLVQPILIASKVNQTLDSLTSTTTADEGPLVDVDWILILIPLWAFYGLYVLLWILVWAWSSENNGSISTSNQLFWIVAEQVMWLVSGVVLALRWDNVVTGSYATVVFVPVYVALAFRWIQRLSVMHRVRRDLNRMATSQQLQQQGILNQPYEDCTDEEKEAISKNYIVVTLPAHYNPEDNDDEDEDDDPVHHSPEYEAATEEYYQAFSSLVNGILTGIPLVVLLVLKIDGDITTSWWIVFIPCWVSIGYQLLWNCFLCCFASVEGDMVVVDDDDSDDDDGNNNNNDDDTGVATEQMFVGGNTSMRAFNEPIKGETTTTPPPPQASQDNNNNNSTDEENPPPPPRIVTTEAEQRHVSETTNASSVVLEETETSTPRPPRAEQEEAYESWQSAYEEAEENAMEVQARSQINVCVGLLKLTILGLVVGKLEDDYPTDGDLGYNAMWILFPIFVLSGCFVCCCACFVYGAGQEGLDNLVDRVATKDEEEEQQQQHDEETPAAPAAANDGTNQPTSTTENPTEPPPEDEDDLD